MAPFLMRVFRMLTRARHLPFSREYFSWEEARRASTGYELDSILEKVELSTLKVASGEAACERDSVLFSKVEYCWPIVSALMWAAAKSEGRLSVLDYGGSLGSRFFEHRVFFEGLSEVHWGIVEQANFVERGKALSGKLGMEFFETVEACASRLNPNVALLSSVLQFVEDYEKVIREVVATKPEVIAIDRTVVNRSPSDRLYVQSVPAAIYSASYPCRSISKTRLVSAIERGGYELVSEFDSLNYPELSQIDSFFKGFLFRRAR